MSPRAGNIPADRRRLPAVSQDARHAPPASYSSPVTRGRGAVKRRARTMQLREPLTPACRQTPARSPCQPCYAAVPVASTHPVFVAFRQIGFPPAASVVSRYLSPA